MYLHLLQGKRGVVLARAAALIAAIALVDWRFEVNISFGFLYLFPMLMVGSCLDRWQIGMVAALCTGLSEAFDPFPWDATAGIPRLVLTCAAFFGAGLYVYESARNRRLASQHMQEIEREIDLRRDAEEQLEFLIESSPAAIFTADARGRILLANEAAHRQLGLDPGKLVGENIGQFLPALKAVPPPEGAFPFFRTAMECRCHRESGEVFLAQIWFSTYRTVSGPRLAAMVIDVSEELRDRQESSLEHVLAGSRILVGAVCHEIRNICGAVAVVHAQLARNAKLAQNEDFRALGVLVEALGKMAALELRQSRQPELDELDVAGVIEELRIIIEPSLRDSGIAARWDIGAGLPLVWAEHEALLQVFLNLAKNSQRCMEFSDQKVLTVSAGTESGRVFIRFLDTGPGVAHPQQLFKPFQGGAEGSGLGLYLSRALVRSFGGDVEHEATAAGCCFRVTLTPVSERRDDSGKVMDGEDATAAAGRSYPVQGEPEPATRS